MRYKKRVMGGVIVGTAAVLLAILPVHGLIAPAAGPERSASSDDFELTPGEIALGYSAEAAGWSADFGDIVWALQLEAPDHFISSRIDEDNRTGVIEFKDEVPESARALVDQAKRIGGIEIVVRERGASLTDQAPQAKVAGDFVDSLSINESTMYYVDLDTGVLRVYVTEEARERALGSPAWNAPEWRERLKSVGITDVAFDAIDTPIELQS